MAYGVRCDAVGHDVARGRLGVSAACSGRGCGRAVFKRSRWSAQLWVSLVLSAGLHWGNEAQGFTVLGWRGVLGQAMGVATCSGCSRAGSHGFSGKRGRSGVGWSRSAVSGVGKPGIARGARKPLLHVSAPRAGTGDPSLHVVTAGKRKRVVGRDGGEYLAHGVGKSRSMKPGPGKQAGGSSVVTASPGRAGPWFLQAYRLAFWRRGGTMSSKRRLGAALGNLPQRGDLLTSSSSRQPPRLIRWHNQFGVAPIRPQARDRASR